MVASSLGERHVGENTLQKCRGIQLEEDGWVFMHLNGDKLDIALCHLPVVIVALLGEARLANGALVVGIHYIEIGKELIRRDQ